MVITVPHDTFIFALGFFCGIGMTLAIIGMAYIMSND